MKSTLVKKYLIDLFNEQNIHFSEINKIDTTKIINNWIKAFFPKETSEPYNDQFRWHIYSFNQKSHQENADAICEYQRQFSSDIYIFDESGNFCFIIEKSKLPSFNYDENLGDLYICHCNFKWTFVLTHEHPYIGPFFDKKSL